MKNNSKSAGKFLYIATIALLCVASLLFVLEKTRVTNFYTKPASSGQESPRPVNDVSYTPADPTDNDEINQRKADGTVDSGPTLSATTDPINITLTASAQDEIGGPIVVRTLLPDITSGECTISLSKDATKKAFNMPVVNKGTYYGCEGYDIPVSELSEGTWKLIVSVVSGDRNGVAEQDVEVKL